MQILPAARQQRNHQMLCNQPNLLGHEKLYMPELEFNLFDLLPDLRKTIRGSNKETNNGQVPGTFRQSPKSSESRCSGLPLLKTRPQWHKRLQKTSLRLCLQRSRSCSIPHLQTQHWEEVDTPPEVSSPNRSEHLRLNFSHINGIEEQRPIGRLNYSLLGIYRLFAPSPILPPKIGGVAQPLLW